MITLLLLFFACSASGFTEKISSFVSDITVHTDGHLAIHETITVNLENGRRGLLRDFPTSYRGAGNLKSCVDFALERVCLNGVPVQNCVENLDNGIRIKIGDPYKKLARGTYTYDIYYTTARQLGFFDTHDELYWNVTGTGWQMPIDTVQVKLHLPKDAQIKNVEAYTGTYGSKGTYYTSKILYNNEAVWQSTRPFNQGEGITLVATWQKGVVSARSAQSDWYHFIKDNIAYLILGLGLLLLICYAFYVVILLSKENEQGTIIPLFYPPENLSPSQAHYLVNYGYDTKALAAQLIDMAVQGMITIERKKIFLSYHYEIKCLETISPELRNKYQALLSTLFLKSQTITLTPMNSDIIEATNTVLRNQLLIGMGQYIDHKDEHITALVCMGSMTALAYWLCGGLLDHALVWVYVFAFVSAFVIVWNSIKCYTPRGKKLLNEVEGFKLFLKTDREYLHFTSTPPVRTPQLYEKYLPYAVALNVEEQWTAQFATVFERLKQQGTPYHNNWHVHDLHRLHHYTNIRAEPKIGSTLGHAMSTSRPGSISGSGGRGSSGGGGGGGGGGAW